MEDLWRGFLSGWLRATVGKWEHKNEGRKEEILFGSVFRIGVLRVALMADV